MVVIFHLKSQFTKSWMLSIGGPQCTRMLSNIAKLVTTINNWGILYKVVDNFIASRTFHKVGIRFCWPNQTHQQVYREQIHFANNQLCHQMGGSEGTAHQYNDCDYKIHIQVHSHEV